jgi:hypothetical protein
MPSDITTIKKAIISNGATTLSITTFTITTLTIMTLTLRKNKIKCDTQDHNDTQPNGKVLLRLVLFILTVTYADCLSLVLPHI